MPAKKQISRQDISDAAFELVRQEGMEALNVRTVAQKCNCSTQPVYNCFSGMEELKKEVLKRTNLFFDEFIGKEIAKGEYPEYKAVGMGYINFARQEKHLFKYMFMREKAKATGWEEKSFSDNVFALMRNYGLNKDDAAKLHSEMWIFVHGIATMFATDYLEWDWETVSEMVTDVYRGLASGLNIGGNK